MAKSHSIYTCTSPCHSLIHVVDRSHLSKACQTAIRILLKECTRGGISSLVVRRRSLLIKQTRDKLRFSQLLALDQAGGKCESSSLQVFSSTGSHGRSMPTSCTLSQRYRVRSGLRSREHGSCIACTRVIWSITCAQFMIGVTIHFPMKDKAMLMPLQYVFN